MKIGCFKDVTLKKECVKSFTRLEGTPDDFVIVYNDKSAVFRRLKIFKVNGSYYWALAESKEDTYMGEAVMNEEDIKILYNFSKSASES